MYPPERDTYNRLGKKWHALSIDLDSVYGSFDVPASSLIVKTIPNPFYKKCADRSGATVHRAFFLADLYFYILKDAPVLRCFGADGEELSGFEVRVSVSDSDYFWRRLLLLQQSESESQLQRVYVQRYGSARVQ